MSYKIKLPIFEGPFDLLLYLIRKNEVDIYDIPIADITRQYMEYIEIMKLLDLDLAGEFIEMVATLMLIKVRMLLPQVPQPGEEEIEDPRAQLVSQLLEYRRFKEASMDFMDLESDRRQYFSRTVPEEMKKVPDDADDQFLADVSIFDLIAAFKKAIDNMPKVTMHQVKVIKITIEDQVGFIASRLAEKPYILFREMCKPLDSKMALIVTFMATLDLIRLQLITIKQSDPFGEIRLVPLGVLTIEKYLDIRNKQLISESEEDF